MFGTAHHTVGKYTTTTALKVCLISLPSAHLINDRDIPFLGILTLAAVLREAGLEVVLVDLASLPEDQWHIPDADVYGIGLVSPQFTVAHRVIKILRERQPSAKVILGGIHPTALPEETYRRLQPDAVVAGEAEDVIVPVVNGWLSDPVVSCPVTQNLDRLPYPAVDMIDIYDYMRLRTNSYVSDGKLEREMYIQTGRGCPHWCRFCSQRCITGGKVRYFSLDYVEGLVKHYQQRYDCHQYYFFDDTFIISKKRVQEFCDRCRTWNIVWHCLARSDNFSYSLYKEMYQAGCRCITFGIESGSDTILKNIDKRTTAKKHYLAMEAAKEAGLKVRAQIIVGLPGETDDTVEETADLIRRSSADVWGAHLFIPLPGSHFFEHADEYGIPIERDPDYQAMTTIGKPGHKSGLQFAQDPDKLNEWHEYILGVIKDRNIDKVIRE